MRVHSHCVPQLPDTALNDVAHAELPPNLSLDVDLLAPVGKRGFAGDDGRAGKLREIGGQVLGNAIGKIGLFGIPAEICEWQHSQ